MLFNRLNCKLYCLYCLNFYCIIKSVKNSI
nr:MAG TPA: hypothetical protein [Caudoviricetes sp.]